MRLICICVFFSAYFCLSHGSWMSHHSSVLCVFMSRAPSLCLMGCLDLASVSSVSHTSLSVSCMSKPCLMDVSFRLLYILAYLLYIYQYSICVSRMCVTSLAVLTVVSNMSRLLKMSLINDVCVFSASRFCLIDVSFTSYQCLICVSFISVSLVSRICLTCLIDVSLQSYLSHVRLVLCPMPHV